MTSRKVVIITSIICWLGTLMIFWVMSFPEMYDLSENTRKNLNNLGMCLPVVVFICFAILIGSNEKSDNETHEIDKQKFKKD